MDNLRCFISYSWDNDNHKDWVRSLATNLQDNGIHIYLDQWDIYLGKDLPKYMETSIRESDFVLLVCTPNFAQKANKGLGGVGYEKSIVTGEIFENESSDKKFIPILKNGTIKESLPSYLQSKAYIDFRSNKKFDSNLKTLLRHFFKSPKYKRPPLGKKPNFSESNEQTMDEEFDVNKILSCENRKNNLIQNGKDILFLNSKSTSGPAECTIYANTVNRFYEKAYKLETYITSITLAELEKLISIYYSTFRYNHIVSAFGINQETYSWFGFGPLNFLKALKMQEIRYAEIKKNNEYIHHNEVATFIDELNNAIFYISSQPRKKRKQDDLVTLERVNIGFIFSKTPYNNIYHDFFEKIGSIPGFVDEINEPLTISKKIGHTITNEGYIIDNPNEEFGGWVCGIFGNNATNSKITEINNEKIIINFNQHHEIKDICRYDISSVYATTLHTAGFSTIIVNYKGDWSII